MRQRKQPYQKPAIRAKKVEFLLMFNPLEYANPDSLLAACNPPECSGAWCTASIRCINSCCG